MAKHLLIVHGYSDNDSSFMKLRALLAEESLYCKENIHSINYSSLDDQSTMNDFADRLDDIYESEFKKKGIDRIDVLAHSTGSLVVRAWLYQRRKRQRSELEVLNNRSKQAGDSNLIIEIDVPVEYLFLFSPANFGSDLARLGQSVPNKIFASLIKKLNPFKQVKVGDVDLFESGTQVLQALEPASPFQWDLSVGDLFNEDYFGNDKDVNKICFPFVFAAGSFQDPPNGILVYLRKSIDPNFDGQPRDIFQAVLGGIFQVVNLLLLTIPIRAIKAATKVGTDSVVRICGTSLNSRKCNLLNPSESESESKEALRNALSRLNEFSRYEYWERERKFDNIAFTVFYDYEHNSIIRRAGEEKGNWAPLELLKKAKGVTTVEKYTEVAKEFDQRRESDPSKLDNGKRQFQQFFFKISDDAGFSVTDYELSFEVRDENEHIDRKETNNFRQTICEPRSEVFYTHSVDSSYQIVMLDSDKTKAEIANLTKTGKKLYLNVTAWSQVDGVIYPKTSIPIRLNKYANIPLFFYPNTTTLIDIVIDRIQKEGTLDRGTFESNQKKSPFELTILPIILFMGFLKKWHPFIGIPLKNYGAIFFPLLLLTIIFSFVFQFLDPAVYSVLQFEFSGSGFSPTTTQILQTWQDEGKLRAAFSLGLDFLFMPVYSSAIGLACMWATITRKIKWKQKNWGNGTLITWGQWLAVVFDILENIALLSIIFGNQLLQLPAIATGSAIIKFLLIALGIVYSLCTWLNVKGREISKSKV